MSESGTLIELKKQLKKCYVFRDISGQYKPIFYDAEKKVRLPFLDETSIRKMIPGWYRKFEERRARCCIFHYTPFERVLSKNENDYTTYNTYIAPRWRKCSPQNQIPELYRQFFLHLVNNDEPSYEYLLDWVADSLRPGKTQTFLCAIGPEGTGKGTLAEILRHLHGPTNYSKVRDTIFKEKFNGQLRDKTLVYVDEASITTKEALDRMKDMCNDFIEIERKGVDAINDRNWASFYLSSNDYLAIKFGAGDRRFSIVEMTQTPLVRTELIKVRDKLIDPQNVAELGKYLLQREIKRDMLIPFKAAHAEELKEAGLSDWEYWLVFDFAAKQQEDTEIALKAVQEAIISEFPGLRRAPGRRTLDEVCRKYPGVLRMRQERCSPNRWMVFNPGDKNV